MSIVTTARKPRTESSAIPQFGKPLLLLSPCTLPGLPVLVAYTLADDREACALDDNEAAEAVDKEDCTAMLDNDATLAVDWADTEDDEREAMIESGSVVSDVKIAISIVPYPRAPQKNWRLTYSSESGLGRLTLVDALARWYDDKVERERRVLPRF